MKTAILARIMVLVGGVGVILLAISFRYWLEMGEGLRTDHSDLLGFLALLFGGAFVVGLTHAWFALFAVWTGKLLPKEYRAGSGNGVGLGVSGFVANVAMVLAVIFAGAASSRSPQTTYILLGVLVLQVALLALEWRWTQGFSARSVAAETASV